MTTQVVQSKGIFHGLPTFGDSPELTNLTAVVTGANGISGYHMVKALAESPKRWSKIYCLSRRPPPDYFFSGLEEATGEDCRGRVKHLSVDFMSSPEEIGKALQRIGRV
jgi:NAD(P)-dependent dehydrogenase (short-subunit alcohol dehydrogenase family)